MTQYQQFHLPCGTPVCVAEMPWMESVSTGLWAAVGGRHDPARYAGLAHFAEHMLFQGTKHRSARRLNREVERAGGTMDAFTSEDHTAFFIRGPGEHFPGFMEVLLDLFLHSKIESYAVEKERDVIGEEISMYREQPSQHVEDLLCRTLWPKHALGNPIAGYERTIKHITKSEIESHVNRFLGAGNTVISVAGKVTVEQVRKTMARLLPEGLPGARRAPFRPFRLPPRRTPAVISEKRELDQVQLAVAFHSPGRHDPSQYALRLLNVIIGENTSSRLWVELREKRGLCYDSGSDITALQDTGVMHLYAGVDPEKIDEALKVIFRELRVLKEKAVSPSALKAAMEFTLSASRMGMESTSNQMTMMAESLLLYGKQLDQERIQRKIRAVTPEQVRKVAETLFRPGRLTVAMVGPEYDHAHVLKAARGLG